MVCRKPEEKLKQQGQSFMSRLVVRCMYILDRLQVTQYDVVHKTSRARSRIHTQLSNTVAVQNLSQSETNDALLAKVKLDNKKLLARKEALEDNNKLPAGKQDKIAENLHKVVAKAEKAAHTKAAKAPETKEVEKPAAKTPEKSEVKEALEVGVAVNVCATVRMCFCAINGMIYCVILCVTSTSGKNIHHVFNHQKPFILVSTTFSQHANEPTLHSEWFKLMHVLRQAANACLFNLA